jgi:phage terminase small subunit
LSDEAATWFGEVLDAFDLEPHDVMLLTAAAECWDRLQEARRMLDRDGLVVITGSGVKAHPACAVERDCRMAFARLVRELALDAMPEPDVRIPRRRGVR